MAGLLRRDPMAMESASETRDLFERLDSTFDAWMRMLPMRRWMTADRQWTPPDLVQVDEYYENGTLVIRAELPGIDPDRDVELTITEGVLHIRAERRQEQATEGRGYVRKELHYGSFARSLPLPEGVSEDDITASYKDGILEIRVPAPQAEPVKRIEVAKG